MLRKASRLIIKLRFIIVTFVICGIIFNIYQIKNVRFRHNLKDLVPLEHRYVKLHGLMGPDQMTPKPKLFYGKFPEYRKIKEDVLKRDYIQKAIEEEKKAQGE